MEATHQSIRTKKDLAQLSENLKKSPAYTGLIAVSKTFNEVLKVFYGISENQELKSFKKWKKEGYIVKKGEKAYTFWSRPISAEHKEKMKNVKTGKSEDIKEEYSFFNICKLFSSDQVEGLENED